MYRGILPAILSGLLLLAAVPSSEQSQGSLAGAVVATRTGAQGERAVLTEVHPRQGQPIDQVEIKLPKNCTKELSPEMLPPGWSMTRDGRKAVLSGPAQEESFRLRLDVGACEAPTKIEVTLLSGGRRAWRRNLSVGQWPPVGPVGDLHGIVRLPSVVTPGDEISVSVLDPQFSKGQWTLSGAVLDVVETGGDQDKDISREGDDVGKETESPPHSPRVGLVPSDLDPGEPPTITYIDEWGDTAVDEILDVDDMRVVPGPSDPSSDPRITDCTARTFVGDEACICGWFPEFRQRRSLLIDGQPLGEPLASGSLVAVFKLPAGVTPGEHVISGLAAAGFPAGDQVRIVVLKIHGHLDQEELWLRQSTEMSLRVEGTEEAVTFSITNHTTDVITIEGGASQQATTSGGADNSLSRKVTGIRKGNFNINYQLEGSRCPCSGSESEISPEESESTPVETEESAPGTEIGGEGDKQDVPCSVAIKGDEFVCRNCLRRQVRTRLDALGAPPKGTYDWKIIRGKENVRLEEVRTNRSRAFVTGTRASPAKKDVEVEVTYTVQGVSCKDTHELTVVEPDSLKVSDEWTFTIVGRDIQSALHGGVEHQGQVPRSVLADLAPVLRQPGLTSNHVGSVVVRYYEVLNQFGDRWRCDGELTEVITPRSGVRTGGAEVDDGLPEHPDRIYWLDRAGRFVEKILLQEIKVSGCVVRHNRITLNRERAQVEELTQKEYGKALEALKRGSRR